MVRADFESELILLVFAMLQEISDVFSDKVFLLTNKLSIADILFYYMLYPIMVIVNFTIARVVVILGTN